MRTHLSFKITIPELAELCGVHPTTLKRDLKRAKLDRDCLPSVVRWLYPRLLIAGDEGKDPRKAWKRIQERRKEAKERRAAHAARTINVIKDADARRTVSDAFAQAFPSYD